MTEAAIPLTYHAATLADARNKALRQLGIARALLVQGKFHGADEAIAYASAYLESMTGILDRMEEQHARTVKVLARQLARVDAILEDIE